MATNLKKFILLTCLVAAFSILAIETFPSKIIQKKIVSSQNTFSETSHPKQVNSSEHEVSTPHASTYTNQKEITSHDATAAVVKTEAGKNSDINQCTLTAIQNSALDNRTKRKLGNFLKAFDKKGRRQGSYS